MRFISTSAIGTVGVSPINGKTGATVRARPHKSRDDDQADHKDADHTDHADADPDNAAPLQPGIGSLIDKIV